MQLQKGLAARMKTDAFEDITDKTFRLLITMLKNYMKQCKSLIEAHNVSLTLSCFHFLVPP